MVSSEKGLPAWFNPGEKKPDGSGIDPASTKNVKWVARLGSQTYGNVAVAGGKVFVGTNDFAIGDTKYQSTRGGLLKCLDEATGKLLWKLVVPKFETNKPNFNYDNIDLGICSAPAVNGNRVYLVTNRGEVLCLDTEGMANGNDGPFMDEGKFSVPTGRSRFHPAPATATLSGASTWSTTFRSGRKMPRIARSWSTVISFTSTHPTVWIGPMTACLSRTPQP